MSYFTSLFVLKIVFNGYYDRKLHGWCTKKVCGELLMLIVSFGLNDLADGYLVLDAVYLSCVSVGLNKGQSW